MKLNITQLFKKKREYESELNRVEALLKEKIDFDFTICAQPGDGLVIVDESQHNGLLSECLFIINNKGILSYEDYLTTVKNQKV